MDKIAKNIVKKVLLCKKAGFGTAAHTLANTANTVGGIGSALLRPASQTVPMVPIDKSPKLSWIEHVFNAGINGLLPLGNSKVEAMQNKNVLNIAQKILQGGYR